MPFTYRPATDEFRRYLADMRERTLIESDNILYTGTEAVFRSFRGGLAPRDALRVADELPAVLRAIFVWRWDIEAPHLPWAERGTIRAVMLALRADHNFCRPRCWSMFWQASGRPCGSGTSTGY
ncbi:DUF2267 domain-containing protein [Paracoccus sp. MC1862]|uniref:DUF2267 domain-containing protein n=1 Tax=Paracoccus sp. MC1862 TaxID=2760307 RepID=UPI0016046243|nr:DUF2267 domain-containing protein [Paracoccus sp. MC1862]MBB1496657.1 DUF2267 domain-containing protein [Paracoccus sp. MC1862]QQO43672.1 DUF2267 domain-containing protein [Paracoccus sp. MC1862]